MASAFQIWADAGPLRFRQVQDGNVNIDIDFASRRHGDALDFDGRGNNDRVIY